MLESLSKSAFKTFKDFVLILKAASQCHSNYSYTFSPSRSFFQKGIEIIFIRFKIFEFFRNINVFVIGNILSGKYRVVKNKKASANDFFIVRNFSEVNVKNN